MKKIWLIASHEFVQNFRSRGYLVATFGAPLVFLGFIIVFSTGKGLYSNDTRLIRMGLLDETNTVISENHFDPKTERQSRRESAALAFGWSQWVSRSWTMVDSRVNALREIQENKLDGVLILSRGDSESNPFVLSLMVHNRNFHMLPFMRVNPNWLFQRWIKEGLDRTRWFSILEPKEPQVERVDEGGMVRYVDFSRAILNENEKASWVHVGVFLVAIMLLSGYLSTGLADEREQKTLEYLFTLLTPFQLLLGKLLGVIMSGILQVVTWGLTFVFPTLFFFWSMKHAFSDWLFPFFFFFFGYTFYGAVLLSLSASASSGRESRQIASGWLFFNAIPLAFYPFILAEPHSWFTVLLSVVPVSAPITMMIRLGIEQVAWLEIVLSLLILVVSTGLILRLSAGRVMRNMMRRL